jgi:two-component system, chemotaxis family, response regulator Rcp1
MESRTDDKTVHVLLVEDNPGDVRWAREMLKDVEIPTILAVAKDGVEAMEILLRLGSGTGERPDVVLLDLELPRLDGQELLAEIEADEYLRAIPVVILATSERDQDVDRCFALGAMSYISKPVDAERLSLVLSRIVPGLVSQNTGTCPSL